MTKEELKQQFYKYIKDHEDYFDPREPWTERIILQIWLDCAEPREKRIAELEKENAELKGIKDVATLIRANNDTVTTLMQLNNMLVSKSQQLTKAKEIIKRLLATPRIIYDRDEDGELTSFFNSDYEELKKQAEQFLNSEVEK